MVRSSDSSSFEEVEVRLRTTISSHRITGYEVNCSVKPNNPYVQIVRWNGALGDFTELDGRGVGCSNGDVLKGTISGNTITVYINNVQIFQVVDSTFSSGNPGMGYYISGSAGDQSHYGFSSFTATDGVGAPETYLVTAVDASLNLYDLSTNNLTGRTTSGEGKTTVAIGPNNRLAFVAGDCLSVIDLTIGREIRRFPAIHPSGSIVFTGDGRWLLFVDQSNGTLNVFDPAGLEVVRRVSLVPAMGYGALNGPVGSIVVVGEKAYIVPITPDPNRPAMGVVDVRSWAVRPIAIPYGRFDGVSSGQPNAAATPDGQYIVIAENVNGTSHLYFISTRTGQIALDSPQSTYLYGVVISPIAIPSYGYVVTYETNGDLNAVILDVNSDSPTFGQLLPATSISLSDNNLLQRYGRGDQSGGKPPRRYGTVKSRHAQPAGDRYLSDAF